LGISNLIKAPEFTNGIQFHGVIEILEDTMGFIQKIQKLDVTDSIKVFIGKENLLPEMQSVSMIATKYYLHSKGESGIIGLVGPIRMNYPYNMAMLDMIRNKISVFLLA
jgi:heat-inducible transcriptional repressor